ncbi:MAG: amino acid ABC transporter permease [Termitinemataceae bacterium]|nr:MAG: amino acid ABC transporter permease [Termitinemataceae bacterium]
MGGVVERPFFPDHILKAFPLLLKFLPVTLFVMAVTTLVGCALGALLAYCRLHKNPFVSACSGFYLNIMRCTPSIVLLFIMYYAMPRIVQSVFHISIDNFSKVFFVISALALLFSATMCEVMRSAYLSIDKRQTEAALSVGLSERQAFFRIVLPQAVSVAIPPFCNALIALSKEGALAYTIGLIDMMGQGTLIIARAYGSYALETYIALAIIYWLLTIVIERTFLIIEKKLSKGKRVIAVTK